MAGLDIRGFRCVNHLPDRQTLAAGAFDIDNPCSWCANRRHIGKTGPAFHYVEFGRWEFPFIAETNCANYRLVAQASAPRFDIKASAAARHPNHVSEIGRQYVAHWHAFATNEVPFVDGRKPRVGEVTYPSGKSAAVFYRELNDLRSDLFGLRHDLQVVSRQFRAEWGIRDSRLDFWLEHNGKLLTQIAKQTEDLEAGRRPSGLATVSKWAFNNIAGNAAWDSFKFVTSMLAEMVRR